jgi:transposase
MTNTIAAIDVHKKVLMVVTGVQAGDSHRFPTTRDQLERLGEWLQARGVQEVVMESTAQYWKPVWQALEPHFRLHLAQAQSNRAPRGRKHDFGDARRLLRRMLAGELILSFVPEPEQRSWRTATRMRQQLVRDRVRLQAQIEALLEEAAIKLSSVLSDLLSLSGRRILQAIAEGETDPAQLAELGDRRLRCGRQQLEQALDGRIQPLHQQLLALYLERLAMLDRHIEQLEQLASQAMHAQRDAILRLAEVPGLGLESARQIVAGVGATAETFPSPDRLASWTGICPGRAESAGVSHSARSAKGNRHFRRVLVPAAQAAAKTKGSYLQTVFRRLVPRLGFAKAMWALAHRLCRLIWKLLHDRVRYLEHGLITDPRTRKHLASKHLRALTRLGFHVHISEPAR